MAFGPDEQEEQGDPRAGRLRTGEGEASGVPTQIAPAHRTPEDLQRFSQQIEEPGTEENVRRDEVADAEMERAPHQVHRREGVPGGGQSVQNRRRQIVERDGGDGGETVMKLSQRLEGER